MHAFGSLFERDVNRTANHATVQVVVQARITKRLLLALVGNYNGQVGDDKGRLNVANHFQVEWRRVESRRIVDIGWAAVWGPVNDVRIVWILLADDFNADNGLALRVAFEAKIHAGRVERAMIQIGWVARHRLGDDLVPDGHLLIFVRIQYADLCNGRN